MTKLVDAMESQTASLSTASDKAAGEAHLMRDKLMVDVTTLQELVERIEQQRNEVEISVASQAQALGRVTQSALEHSDHINAALKIRRLI